jgi:hypothetical protein
MRIIIPFKLIDFHPKLQIGEGVNRIGFSDVSNHLGLSERRILEAWRKFLFAAVA